MKMIKVMVESLVGKKAFKKFLVLVILALVAYNFLSIKNTLFFIISRYPFSLFAIINIISIYVLLRYSNYKSSIKIRDELYKHNLPIETHSREFKGIYFLLTDYSRTRLENMKNKKVVEIVNGNKRDSVIKATGKITLYSDGTKVFYKKYFEQDFNVNYLEADTQLQLFYTVSDLALHEFTGFKVELQSLVFDNGSFYNNVTLKSNLCIQNTYWILDHLKLYDYRFFLVKSKYNLKWLKQITRRTIDYVRYRCSAKVFLGYNPSKEGRKAEKKDFFERWCCRICLGVIFLFLFILTALSWIQLVKLIFLFLQWVGEFIFYD